MGPSREDNRRQTAVGSNRLKALFDAECSLSSQRLGNECQCGCGTSLLTVLRGRLGVTSPHFGCGANECGACNVIIGTHAVAACDTPLWSVAEQDVTTVEGLGTRENPHPLQRAFVTEQAMQCGYCISGILISAAALLKRNANPSAAEV